jgi:TPR repeat protein
VQLFHRHRLAAEQGDAGGQCNLGMCYLHGVGVEKDNDEAVRWFRLAADQNDASGLSQLATCYSRGVGVEMNPSEAIRLFSPSTTWPPATRPELAWRRTFAKLFVGFG